MQQSQQPTYTVSQSPTFLVDDPHYTERNRSTYDFDTYGVASGGAGMHLALSMKLV